MKVKSAFPCNEDIFADNFGKYDIISEATPATTGDDIDVPSWDLYLLFGIVE